jgi:ribose 5-phosphate isomerase B
MCTSGEMAKLSRQHNDANMLALGGRLTELPDALDIVRAWLTTEFEGGRHERRVGQLNEM